MRDHHKKDLMLRLARIESARTDELEGEDDRCGARVVFRLVSSDSLAQQFELEAAEIQLPTSYEVALVPGPDLPQ